MSYSKKPIATFRYSRRLTSAKPGMHNFKFNGKNVKGLVSSDGRSLQIVQAPPTVVKDIKKLAPQDKLLPDGKNLRISKPKTPPKQAPKPKPVRSTPTPKPKPATPVAPSSEKMATAMENISTVVQKAQGTAPPQPASTPAAGAEQPEVEKKELKDSWVLTDADRKAARNVPVASSGVIECPYVDWDAVPENCKIKPNEVGYTDYATASAPGGMLKLLRDGFRANRLYQKAKPTNIDIVGPPGTGKSTLVKAFAAETGLPYYQVIGQDGLTAEDLLGRSHMRKVNGATIDVWEDGIVTRAVRTGGILHFDEVNVFPAPVMMKLNELMDAKRQLNMQDLNGEIIKAHPDLFIVFSRNPPDFEGVTPLPKPVQNRMKEIWLPFAPVEIDHKIIVGQAKGIGIKSSELSLTSSGRLAGSLASDVDDFTKIIVGLRADKTLPHHPSMRQTLDFIMARKQGYDFKTAFQQTIGDSYIAVDEDTYGQKMQEALQSVGRS